MYQTFHIGNDIVRNKESSRHRNLAVKSMKILLTRVIQVDFTTIWCVNHEEIWWWSYVTRRIQETKDNRLIRDKHLIYEMKQEESEVFLVLSKEKNFAQIKNWNCKKMCDGVKLPQKLRQACEQTQENKFSYLIVDSGGLLRSKDNLMPLHCILQGARVTVVNIDG